ncbi:MAG: hydantoinase/oxoprolinase family protein [Rhodospirillales bacterium]|nr:hydantoinase/oxoprolinase family protein [Rhodospirillales bacterium]
MSRGHLVVGVDVGGTYTDLFLFDEASGAARVSKVPSMRGQEATAFAEGITALAPLPGISAIVHGTTVGTNALLERKGAPAGLITTQGFRDVLEMRRRDRRQTWGLSGDFSPVIDRSLRAEVNERTLANGTLHTPVDPAEVKEVATRLLAAGARALCIVFLHSYANPDNERAALAAARAVWPNNDISISSDILPEIREFERTSTAALNAVLQPVVGLYLGQLDERLRKGGFGGEFLIVQSNGGVMSVETAQRLPVRTALSGPAAGVIAAAHIATEAGFADVITGDVGGTSFDVSLISRGEPALAAQSTIDFGLVVRTPMIEITTIGAGGGSIARVDAAGLLQVGPQSAGSVPGPVCYAAGGTRPTVTDANVVLGRINPERPIGGKLARLDRDAAAAAIMRDIGGPLGLDVTAAAAAILRVANARMASALRLVSIERGHDPKRFSLMPFGGGGALHAGALIREVGLARALVPRYPGVTSALGCVIADMRHDRVRTLNRLLSVIDPVELRAEMDLAASELSVLLDRAGVAFTGRLVTHELDMSYLGQTHTVAVRLDLAPDGSGAVTRDLLMTAFETTYRAAYGRLLSGAPVRVLNLRTAVIGRRPKIDLLSLAPDPRTSFEAAYRGTRRVWFGEWLDVPVLDRLALPVGCEVLAPAVLEQPDTTVLIEPGQVGRVDRFGNIIIAAVDEVV